MSVIYSVVIQAVDSERMYSVRTPDPEEALAFLERYDHEGADTCGAVFTRPGRMPGRVISLTDETLEGEELYKYLREKAGRKV